LQSIGTKNKMKIVYDDIIFELQRAGGVSKYWMKLIGAFSQNSEVELENIQGEYSRNNILFPRVNKLEIIKDSILPVSLRRYLPVMGLRKYDIFHSSYYRTPIFSKNEMKQVVTVHDFMYEYFDNGIKKHIHMWQKRKAMKKADAIICVSNNTKKDLLQLYPEIEFEKLHVIPNGVDKEFKIIDVTIEKSKKYLLYVGSRIGCKNFEFNLKLMSNSDFIKKNGFKLVCVGGGEFTENEYNLFQKYKLESKISQVANVENDELNKLYNGAYALLFPSRYEGYGIPALEAQKAGCPVLYAITSSLPEVMGYAILGYQLDNLDEASKKLALLNNQKFKDKIVLKGLEHASKLSWENCAALTLGIYKKVLNER
jgi:glycosyltransferase involved in cell wall biosynthesis